MDCGSGRGSGARSVSQHLPSRNGSLCPFPNIKARFNFLQPPSLREHFLWPSPDAGFALYLSSQSAQKLPLNPEPILPPAILQTSSQARNSLPLTSTQPPKEAAN